MEKSILKLTVLLTLSLTTFSTELFAQDQSFSYAYVSIMGKDLSKKLKVDVDLGSTPEQIELGEQYSDTLWGIKSYAAVLNFLTQQKYELVESLLYIESGSYQGTGGSSVGGIIFIMKKEITVAYNE